MNKIILISSMFLFVAQFELNDAGLLDTLERWIFGSIVPTNVLCENEQAEKKFIDDEAARISRPRVLKEKLKEFQSNISEKEEYYDNSNFIMRIFIRMYIYYLHRQESGLEKELDRAEDEMYLEPFCDGDEREAATICSRAFKNSYFKSRGYHFPDVEKNDETRCVSIDISRIENEKKKIVYNRKVRKCVATTANRKIFFTFYLIAGPSYLKNKRRLEYYILLIRDARLNTMKESKFRDATYRDSSTIQVAAYVG